MSFEQKQRAVGKTVTPVSKKSGAKKGPYIYYTLKSGDSFWSIAKKYNGVTEEDIMKLNNLENPKHLKPGQVLKIKRKN